MPGKKGVRDRIIIKALELFYIQGVNNTGINQIIKEANSAKASFYQYFPSKDDLVNECLEINNSLIKAKIKSLTESSSDFPDFINKWVSTIEENINNRKTYNGCPVANIKFSMSNYINEKHDNIFKSIINQWTDLIYQFLLRLREEKAIPQNTDLKKLSARMMYLHQGASAMWRLTGDIKYYKDLKTISDELL